MAGTASRRELTTPAVSPEGVRFLIGGPEHDGAIRQLLRENPMPGAIALTLEREPNYFLGESGGDIEEQTIVAYGGNKLLCVGRCTIRSYWLGGIARRVGYLSELRLDRTAAARVQILRSGFTFFAVQQKENPADFYFTSVAADNMRARGLLERGIRGLPQYHFLTEFVTRLLPISGLVKKTPLPRGYHLERGTVTRVPALVRFLNQQSRNHDLARCWTEADFNALDPLGLVAEDLQILFRDDEIVGCAGLWDQRGFRQTVIRGYSSSLRVLRPLANLFAALSHRLELPAVHSCVPLAFLSPFLFDPSALAGVPQLIAAATAEAARRQIKIAAVGFPAHDARANFFRRRYSGREYRTRLYGVSLPELATAVSASPLAHYCPDVAYL